MLLQGVSDPRWEWTACQEKQCPPRGRDRVMDDQDGGGRPGQTVGELPHPCLSGRAVGGEATGHAEGLALGRSKKTEGHQKCSRLLTQSRRVGMGTPSGGEGSKWSGGPWVEGGFMRHKLIPAAWQGTHNPLECGLPVLISLTPPPSLPVPQHTVGLALPQLSPPLGPPLPQPALLLLHTAGPVGLLD